MAARMYLGMRTLRRVVAAKQAKVNKEREIEKKKALLARMERVRSST